MLLVELVSSGPTQSSNTIPMLSTALTFPNNTSTDIVEVQLTPATTGQPPSSATSDTNGSSPTLRIPPNAQNTHAYYLMYLLYIYPQSIYLLHKC